MALTYSIPQHTRWIWSVYAILILGFGTLGNILSILVLKRPLLWRMPLTIYLMALAVVDLLVLWIGLVDWWLLITFDFTLVRLNVEVCHVMGFLLYLFQYLSAAIVTAISVQRFISIVFPVRTKDWNSRRNILISLAVMGIILIVLSIPVIFLCKDTTTPLLVSIVMWTDFTVRCIVPFLIIPASSAMIIMKLRTIHKSKRRQMSRDSIHVQRPDKKVTIMLMTLCLLHVLCVSPQAALIWVIKERHVTTHMVFLNNFAHALLYLNNATNFLVYFFAAPNFRRELQRMFTRNHDNMTGITLQYLHHGELSTH